jgi:hypothetical protein
VDVESILLLCLLFAALLAPAFVLRFFFRRSKRPWLSKHPTLLAVLLTWTLWTTVFTVLSAKVFLFTTAGVSLSGAGGLSASAPATAPPAEDTLDQALLDFEHSMEINPSPEKELKLKRLVAEENAIGVALLGLTKGQIAFDVPPNMKEGKPEKAEVRIAQGVQETVTKTIKAELRATAQVEQIDVAPYMIVKLKSDPKAFDINPLTEEKQLLIPGSYTPWAWNIMPLQSGTQSLFLSVGTRFKLPERGEETKFQPLYTRSITVQVDRIYEGKEFVHNNWQWLAGTLVIPLAGFIWHHWKRKPRQTQLDP